MGIVAPKDMQEMMAVDAPETQKDYSGEIELIVKTDSSNFRFTFLTLGQTYLKLYLQVCFKGESTPVTPNFNKDSLVAASAPLWPEWETGVAIEQVTFKKVWGAKELYSYYELVIPNNIPACPFCDIKPRIYTFYKQPKLVNKECSCFFGSNGHFNGTLQTWESLLLSKSVKESERLSFLEFVTRLKMRGETARALTNKGINSFATSVGERLYNSIFKEKEAFEEFLNAFAAGYNGDTRIKLALNRHLCSIIIEHEEEPYSDNGGRITFLIGDDGGIVEDVTEGNYSVNTAYDNDRALVKKILQTKYYKTQFIQDNISI